EEIADALVPRRLGIAAHEEIDPVGEVRARRPHFLAVDHEVIALVLRARGEAGQIGAGAGLGVALAPDVLAAQDAGEVAPLLLVGAPLDDGWPSHVDPRLPAKHCGSRSQ